MMPMPKAEEDAHPRSSTTTLQDGLKRAVRQRRASLTMTECNFLQDINDKGEEQEIAAALDNLMDESIFPDISKYREEDDGDDCDEEEDRNNANLGAHQHGPDWNVDFMTSDATKLGSKRRQSILLERREEAPSKVWEAHSKGLDVTATGSRRSMEQRRVTRRGSVHGLLHAVNEKLLDLTAEPNNSSTNRRAAPRRGSIANPLASGIEIARSPLGYGSRRGSYERLSSFEEIANANAKQMVATRRPRRISITNPGDSGIEIPISPPGNTSRRASYERRSSFEDMANAGAKLMVAARPPRRSSIANPMDSGFDIACPPGYASRRASDGEGMTNAGAKQMMEARSTRRRPSNRRSSLRESLHSTDSMRSLLSRRPSYRHPGSRRNSIRRPRTGSLENSFSSLAGSFRHLPKSRRSSLILPASSSSRRGSLIKPTGSTSRRASYRIESANQSRRSSTKGMVSPPYDLSSLDQPSYSASCRSNDSGIDHMIEEEGEEENESNFLAISKYHEKFRDVRDDGEGIRDSKDIESSDAEESTSSERELQRLVFTRKASVNVYHGVGVEISDLQTELRRLCDSYSYDDDDDEEEDLENFRIRSLSYDETVSFQRLSQNFEQTIRPSMSDGAISPDHASEFLWTLKEYHQHYDTWQYEGEDADIEAPRVFSILGTSAADESCRPHVMSPPLMESLQEFLPFSKRKQNFYLKYSLVRDGASMWPFLQKARGSQCTILAIETVEGEAFGCFTSEAWHLNEDPFGYGESFLWRLCKSRRQKSWSIIEQAEMESDIDVFPLQAYHDPSVQLCTHDKLIVGGFEPGYRRTSKVLRDGTLVHENEWSFGLCLEGDLLYGTSSPCASYDSPNLSKVHSDGSPFEIVNLELWTLTPCGTLAEAEKMELRSLFIDEHRLRK